MPIFKPFKCEVAALIFDGLCDGIFLFNQGSLSHAVVDATAFGILQAGRTRTSKTEYISCPGCGRTLYDLEKTIARIKAPISAADFICKFSASSSA